MSDNLKFIRLLLYPFLFFSLAIYLCVYLLSPLDLAYRVSLIAGLLLTLCVFYLEKPQWQKFVKSLFGWRNALLLVPVVFLIFTYGFVLSPLVKTITFEGHRVLGLTALGDYYKHLYVLTSIKTGGLPPHHPFFPSAHLSYYYGYYLLPAAISSVFNLDLSRVFFFYLLFTTFIVLLIVVRLSLALFKSWYQRLLALTLFIFGTGLDIIPTLIQAKAGILTANHIEFWSQILNLNNFLVNNLYTALLWVPQHTLPGIVVLATGLLLLKEKQTSVVWLVLASWFCVISSTFVSVSLFIWCGLSFLFLPRTRGALTVSGLLSLFLLYPYLIALSGRGSLFSFGFYMTPFRYLAVFPAWLNYLLTFITEYGLIILALPIYFLIRRKNNQKEAALVTLAVSLPILLGLFIRSAGFNDYSMRSVLPAQMALPFLMSFGLDKVEGIFWKKIVFLLLMLNFIPSMTGLFYEIHFRLIDRSIIEAPTSDLLINLRQHPVANLAVIDNGDWVFLLPSYGYQPVYSPRLFDSEGYLSATGVREQGLYRTSVDPLFIDPTIGQDYLDVISRRRIIFQDLKPFFIQHKDLNFILPTTRGGKSDANPWLKIMELSGTPGTFLTDKYSLLKGTDISRGMAQVKLILDTKQLQKGALDKQGRLKITPGLWFVIGCRDERSPKLSLEFSDHYRLIDSYLGSKQALCAGQLYYQPRYEKLIISDTSQFSSLYLIPLGIK